MAESLQPGSGTWGPTQLAVLGILPSPILILKGLEALPADKVCVCVCMCVYGVAQSCPTPCNSMDSNFQLLDFFLSIC